MAKDWKHQEQTIEYNVQQANLTHTLQSNIQKFDGRCLEAGLNMAIQIEQQLFTNLGDILKRVK